MILGAIFAVAAVVSAFSTVKQYQAQKKQAKALNQANEIRRRQELLRQAQERQKQIREARIAQAKVLQAGTNAGAAGDSGITGGFGSIGSQRNNNLSYLNANSVLAEAGSLFESQAVKAQTQGSMWGAIGSLSGSVASMGFSDSGQAAIKKDFGGLFSSGPTATTD